MFNLLVSANGWSGRQGLMPLERIYLNDRQVAEYKQSGVVDLNRLRSLPAIFAEETDGRMPGQVARVGSILEAKVVGRDVHIEFLFDPDVAPISQADLVRLAPALGISIPRKGISPLERTHWSIKEANLFKVLLTGIKPNTREPKVFSLPETCRVDPDQLSAMMPFGGFEKVHAAISRAALHTGMKCNRADDIWDESAIIQDIVNLIDRSAIIVCDCSKRNPNVFYEIGLAHAWGKEVILIAEHAGDIPFDLTHLRHIRYLPNDEGLSKLEEALISKITAIRSGH